MTSRRPTPRLTPVPIVLLAFALAACTGSGASGSPDATGSASPQPSPTSAATAPSPSAAPSTPVALAWAQLAPTGDVPAAREDHTWTVDPASRSAWLFGGRDGGTVLDDLWRYDLATGTWERLTPSGPAPEARFGHTATWVPEVGLVVWAGQQTGFFDDLWAFDPAAGSWRELADAGDRPAARYGSCAALGPDGRLWISHGFTAESGRFSDTRAYDFAAGRWSDETPQGEVPVIRCLHDCLFAPDGQLVLYGGQTTGAPALGDLWTRPVDGGWMQAADGSAPPPRQLYAVATTGSSAVVFGGGAEDRSKLGDLWRLDLATLAWEALSPEGEAPAPRSGVAAIVDPVDGRLLLHGGIGDDGALGDLWELPM